MIRESKGGGEGRAGCGGDRLGSELAAAAPRSLPTFCWRLEEDVRLISGEDPRAACQRELSEGQSLSLGGGCLQGFNHRLQVPKLSEEIVPDQCKVFALPFSPAGA